MIRRVMVVLPEPVPPQIPMISGLPSVVGSRAGEMVRLLVGTIFPAAEFGSQRPLWFVFSPSITACAAASRAIATRNGDALT
jgi:hypothetical protein